MENFFQDLSLDYQEDALFSTRHFCTITSSLFQGELDALFDGNIGIFWTDIDANAGQKSDKNGREEEAEPVKTMEMQVQRRCPNDHGSEEEKALTFELVSQYFCMPIKQAARELNVGVTLLKRRCRALSIRRWPHRKLKSLQTLINNVQELGKETGQDEVMTRNAVEILQKTKNLIQERPNVKLDNETMMLRQACFKENYKRRRLMAIGR